MDAPKKKLLENNFLNSLIIPVAILVGGALIVLGVSHMLSVERDHRDLIREMESQSFGNKWVNAYELSKLMANSQIPKEDHPWVVEKLGDIYKSGADSKTRNFLIVAIGSLTSPESVDILAEAMDDKDPKISFSALAAMGNMPKGSDLPWEKIAKKLYSDDEGVKQAAVLTLAHHQREKYQDELVRFLNDDSSNIRFSAAVGLINFKNEAAVPVLKEILSLEYPKPSPGQSAKGLSVAMVEGLKLNIFEALKRNQWKVVNDFLQSTAIHDSNPKVALKAKELLSILKN